MSKISKHMPNVCWLIGEIQIFDRYKKKVKIYYGSVTKVT